MNKRKKQLHTDTAKTTKDDSTVVVKKEKNWFEKITELKTKYSVKDILTFRGHEGIGYNASLYFGDKKIAFIINDASGGQSYIEEENIKAVKELALACENVGLVRWSVPGLGDIGLHYDIRLFIYDLVCNYDNKKRTKKKVSK